MILLIDNYDSFTYNLLHYLAELGAEVQVKRNDEISVDEVKTLSPEGIVISPGPCDPDKAGICLDLVKSVQNIPMLGVCLGHQAIAQAFGGKIIRTDTPMHGKTSKVTHQGKSVFKGLPSPFTATRYHSLIAEESSLPDCLEITARIDKNEIGEDIIMGIVHKELPLHGVQFHPESIASEHGHDILKNFLNVI